MLMPDIAQNVQIFIYDRPETIREQQKTLALKTAKTSTLCKGHPREKDKNEKSKELVPSCSL